MLAKRIIPCLDCKFIGKRAIVVKGTRFEELKKIGSPIELAKEYYKEEADELCFLDITASSSSRKTMFEVIRKASEEVFIPLTVGGGIKTIKDAENAFRNGADKVSINTAAVKNPKLISQISKEFGKQACVVAIDAKRNSSSWNVFIYGGRKETEIDAIDWAKKAQELGAGELLVTSMDCDGTKKGYDLKLLKKISETVSISVIASGGAGNLQDLLNAVKIGKADAVLAASIFHYNKYTVSQVKNFLKRNNVSVRSLQ